MAWLIRLKAPHWSTPCFLQKDGWFKSMMGKDAVRFSSQAEAEAFLAKEKHRLPNDGYAFDESRYAVTR